MTTALQGLAGLRATAEHEAARDGTDFQTALGRIIENPARLRETLGLPPVIIEHHEPNP